MSFRQQYNGCKTFGCANCANPDETLYRHSDRLGYPAWHCNLCGAYPPLLLNPPIIALATQTKKARQSLLFLPSCLCPQPQWQRYGLTKSASQRLQCRHCRKVVTQANAKQIATRLQPWLDSLINGVSPHELQRHLGLSNKTFNQHIAQLAELLEHYSNHIERQASKHATSHTLYTFSHTQVCRSGMRMQNNEQCSAHLWTLTTLDMNTGYVYLISDNALTETEEETEEEKQKATKDWQAISEYQLTLKEISESDESDVLIRAEKTYQKILARSQFDQLAYCEAKHAKLKLENSQRNALIRPVYAAHAHMQNLQPLLLDNHQLKLNWFLEHESFIRGAAITTYHASIRQGYLSLYYYHYSLSIEPKKPQQEAENEQRTLSWWNEKWHKLTLSDKRGLHQVGLGILTPSSHITESKLRELLPQKLNWDTTFWQAFEQWLPPTYAQKLSLKRIHQWQAIYRYWHNYLSTPLPRLNIPNTCALNSIHQFVDTLNHATLNPLEAQKAKRDK